MHEIFKHDRAARGRSALLSFATAVAAALVLGGCSAEVALFRADTNWWSSNQPAPTRAAPDQLVAQDGTCPPGESQHKGIAIGMTECDLIRFAGPTDRITIGQNERGERTVEIVYPRGERAGLYRFTDGLLTVIEAPPEPERPATARRRR